MTDFLDDILNEVESLSSSGDKLDQVRAAARRLRDLEHRKAELEDELDQTKRAILELTERDLVKLFSAANMSSLTLEAEGNHPAMTFEKTTFYSAKIPAEKEAEAFSWLHDNGHGDIVKTQVTVALGMGERDTAEQVEAAIANLGVDYNSKLSVHPSTLKAFAKAEIESGHALPMDLLGVYMGETIKLKKVK
jgi:hypothetical protein